MRPTIGFDIGVTCGFCVLDATGNPVDIGMVETLPAKYPWDTRLRHWKDGVHLVFEQWAKWEQYTLETCRCPEIIVRGTLPQAAVIVATENPRFDHGARGKELGAKFGDTVTLGELNKWVCYYAGLYHCELVGVDPAAGHIALTGQSGGDKENSRAWANRRLPPELQLKRKKDHHAADAMGVALRGQSQANHTGLLAQALGKDTTR